VEVSGLDFNLLVPLRALLELRHVTRAAERIHLSQPAMSATLGRLRRHFDDRLLVRAGSGYDLTPLARTLLPLVTDAVRSAELALAARSTFNPLTSDRRFVVVASNYAAGVVGPPLRQYLSAKAPGVSVEFHAMPREALTERHLLECDLMIGPVGYGMLGVPERLFDDDFVCLLDAGHPAAEAAPMPAALLATLPHVQVSFRAGLPTAADLLIDQLGITPHVAVIAQDWSGLPWLIRCTDLVAVLPRRIAVWAAQQGGFVTRELPGEDRGAFSEAAYWHPSRNSDTGLHWMCSALKISTDSGEATPAHDV
jgi:DNA-binding transcriptional LysR family regulator